MTSLLTLYALAKVWSQAFWRSRPEAPASATDDDGTDDDTDDDGTVDRPIPSPSPATSGPRGKGPGFRAPTMAAVDQLTDPATGARVPVARAPRPLPSTMLAATAAMTAVGLVITLVAGPLFAFTQRAATDLMARDPYITSVLPPEARR